MTPRLHFCNLGSSKVTPTPAQVAFCHAGNSASAESFSWPIYVTI